MENPHKAFVLAAGFGTRMLPLSRDLPKPLMPLWGRPVLEHILRLLRDWGVRDVLINVHHGADALIQFAASNPVPPLQLNLSFEPQILGTGGALRRAAWFLDEAPFWLINADLAADLRPMPLCRAFTRHQPLAALWLHPRLGPRTVLALRGLVKSFDAPQPGSPGTFTLCGLHLLSPRILRYLPDDGFSSIIPAYERALKNGERIAGVAAPRCFWADLGTPRQYLDAHAAILRAYRRGEVGARLFDPEVFGRTRAAKKAGAMLSGTVVLGRNVTAARGSRLEDSVVWDHAALGRHTRARNAIIGRDTVLDCPLSGLAGRGDRLLDSSEQFLLSDFGWPPRQVTVLPLGARGSARVFMRVFRGQRRAILMHYDPARTENTLYVVHARFLRRLGVSVPRVLAEDAERNLALLEDIGDRHLQDAARTAPSRRIESWYRQVLDQVALLHARGARQARRAHHPLMPAFSPELFRAEHRLFAEHFLAGRLPLRPAQRRAILRALARVATRLAGAPAVLLHRDLQSSNILLRRGRPVFIDFQGMRLGPAAYDLASLLCDPYVELPETLQQSLLDYYASKRRDRSVKALFWWAAIQRLVQALGAFGRLGRQLGLEYFNAFIPPALRLLHRALEHTEPLPALFYLMRRLNVPRTMHR